MKHLTFILLLVMTCSLAKAQQDDRGYIVKVGEKAPNIELLFPDGTKKQLKDLKGKVIMIQFTASWCGVCRKEMPFIEKDIWLKYKNQPRVRTLRYRLQGEQRNHRKVLPRTSRSPILYSLTRKVKHSTPTPRREPESPVTSSSTRKATSPSSPVSTTRKNLRKW